MGIWNNLKHVRRNFFLMLINTILLYFLFLNISVSTAVFIATIPAILYSIWSKRYILILVVLVVYFVTIGIFFVSIYNPALFETGLEQINILLYLYQRIYPFGLNQTIYHLLGGSVIFYMLIFMFFVLFFGAVLKFDEFKLMIVFSFFIGVFSAMYLVLNIFCFIFPGLEIFLFYNPIFSWTILIFYIILPFFTFILIVLYLELLLVDNVKRSDYKQDSKELNSPKNNPAIYKITKIMLILIVILLLLFIFIGVFE